MSMAQGPEEQLKVARLGFIGAGAMGGAFLRDRGGPGQRRGDALAGGGAGR